jgi:hypothetical protein
MTKKKRKIQIAFGGRLTSTLGLATNLKYTIAIMTITRGTSHFIQDVPKLFAPVLLFGLSRNGRG